MRTRSEWHTVLFADRFGSCPAHRTEAKTVHEAIERLARVADHALATIDPDAALGSIVGFDTPKCADSLDMVEHLLALQEEFGADVVPDESEVSVEAWQRAVMHAMLGPAADRCTWEPATIWIRSPRGIIHERMRRRGGCSCAARQ
jgi:hypothetical protein